MFAEINFLDIFERFGVTMGFLMFLLWTSYNGFGWLGSNIILPLHHRHMLFIDRLEDSLREVAKAQSESMHILTEVLKQTKTMHKEPRP